jgi:hypothetical protein
VKSCVQRALSVVLAQARAISALHLALLGLGRLRADHIVIISIFLIFVALRRPGRSLWRRSATTSVSSLLLLLLPLLCRQFAVPFTPHGVSKDNVLHLDYFRSFLHALPSMTKGSVTAARTVRRAGGAARQQQLFTATKIKSSMYYNTQLTLCTQHGRKRTGAGFVFVTSEHVVTAKVGHTAGPPSKYSSLCKARFIEVDRSNV